MEYKPFGWELLHFGYRQLLAQLTLGSQLMLLHWQDLHQQRVILTQLKPLWRTWVSLCSCLMTGCKVRQCRSQTHTGISAVSFSRALVPSTYTQEHPVGGSRREGGNPRHPLQQSHTQNQVMSTSLRLCPLNTDEGTGAGCLG